MPDKKETKDADEDVVDEEEDEEDLEKLQAEIARMEAEAARISKETEELEKKKESIKSGSSGDGASGGADQKLSNDACSVYVGQVDYTTTPEELVSHFGACGTIERVTIVCDKYTGKPKGFAYLEFQNESSVDNAVKLEGSEFKGRNLKVTAKRVNVPNFQRGGPGGRGGRGRGPPGRGGFRGGRGGRSYRGGYGGRGGGRGGGGYHPYY
eukprot:CAMPEP_0198143848 /NCGR_PEP_ID=MMETSP1443-20131203/10937_1 /TAXON_ID=186043 /ORGANISM="Entomoneis sp., Strain CCMP2396" /LENGTH=209 /DNA_ID=CAMNT_0043807141 /DNA_START=81 /DNA_END=710 /DNA_ORIENTATION=-